MSMQEVGAGDSLRGNQNNTQQYESPEQADQRRRKAQADEIQKMQMRFEDQKLKKARLGYENNEAFKLAIERKHQKQLQEEERQATRENAELLLHHGASFGDQMRGSMAIFKENLKEAGKNVGKWFSAQLTNINNQVDAYMGVYAKYMGTVDARMQGATQGLLGLPKTFKKMADTIGDNLAFSPLVKQTEVIDNLAKMVELGISYNTEQRAFLATVSDKITATFDAFDSNLLHLIRIQQADTTLARMGMENELNEFLNRKFQDTSYLNNGGTFDAVSRILLGANSQLNKNESVGFEYTVQKWLGSLASVGVQDSTLQTFATGVNALVTGDIDSLSSNPALQNMMVMAASKAGIQIGSALTNGISTEDTNKLLRAVVEYTQNIASSNNQVVKSQYANLFGVTISDLTAILNLSTKDLAEISNNMSDYSKSIKAANHELNLGLASRTHISEMVDNLFDNVVFGAGMDISSNPLSYMTWKAASLVDNATGGIKIPIPIPMVGIYELDLMKTIKTGMVGMSVLGNLLGSIGNLGRGLVGSALTGESVFNSKWRATEFTQRGSGFQGINAGATSGTSFSAYVGNSDASALKESSVSESTEATKTTAEENADEESEISQVLKILQSWDLAGYGVKSVLVTPIESISNRHTIAKATVDADSPVRVIEMGGKLGTDEDEVNYPEKIYDLLESVISNNRIDVNTFSFGNTATGIAEMAKNIF